MNSTAPILGSLVLGFRFLFTRPVVAISMMVCVSTLVRWDVVERDASTASLPELIADRRSRARSARRFFLGIKKHRWVPVFVVINSTLGVVVWCVGICLWVWAWLSCVCFLCVASVLFQLLIVWVLKLWGVRRNTSIFCIVVLTL